MAAGLIAPRRFSAATAAGRSSAEDPDQLRSILAGRRQLHLGWRHHLIPAYLLAIEDDHLIETGAAGINTGHRGGEALSVRGYLVRLLTHLRSPTLADGV